MLAKKFIVHLVCLFLVATSAMTQYISDVVLPDSTVTMINDTMINSVRYANTITADDLRAHLTVLASDEYEGRETGEKGNEMTAKYIADHYRNIGLPAVVGDSSYLQPVAFTWSSWEKNEMYINDTRYRHLWDYLAFPTMNKGVDSIVADEVIFLGYGIDDSEYSDYKGNDVKGKVILIFKGEPIDKDSISHITGSRALSPWSEDITYKLKVAKRHGVKMVLIIEDQIKKLLSENRHKVLGASMELGDKSKEILPYADHCYVSTTIAQAIWGDKEKKVLKSRDRSKKKGKACDVKVKPDFKLYFKKKLRTLESNNVLGFIEGSDKKDEVVVVSAHLDHLGKRGDDIYNGADDNGSGTSAVLEIAEAFALAKEGGHGPRRSVLVLNVTGEEKGLLGSAYYAENPIFPLEKTMVNVNVDMIGRTDEKYNDIPNYIYVIGSDRISTDLHDINNNANNLYSQLILDYTYNSEDDPNRYYYRSDHYNFAEKGIPAIFYFSGVHEDYHRTTDTVDKIMFEKMEKVARLIFHTAWDLANRYETLRKNEDVRP